MAETRGSDGVDPGSVVELEELDAPREGDGDQSKPPGRTTAEEEPKPDKDRSAQSASPLYFSRKLESGKRRDRQSRPVPMIVSASSVYTRRLRRKPPLLRVIGDSLPPGAADVDLELILRWQEGAVRTRTKQLTATR